jgi:hypothetical protein
VVVGVGIGPVELSACEGVMLFSDSCGNVVVDVGFVVDKVVVVFPGVRDGVLVLMLVLGSVLIVFSGELISVIKEASASAPAELFIR